MHVMRHLVGLVAIAAYMALPPAAARAATLDAPPGNGRVFSLSARGMQIYECLPAQAGTFGWTFKAPEATLFDREDKIVATHYAGPTWESTADASKIQGTRVASEASLSPGAIPQLLLSAAVLAPGKTFGQVSFIQRVNTVGGSAPAAGCEAATQGPELRVPYTAVYNFLQRD
jgi:hypothetical protein